MKRCPNCGAEFDDSYGFCSTCGTALQSVAPLQTPPPQGPAPGMNTGMLPNVNPNMMPQQPQKKSSTGLIIALIIILVVLLIGGGVLAFLLLNKGDDAPAAPQQVQTEQPKKEETPVATEEPNIGETTDDQKTEDQSVDLSEYQTYYDATGTTFGQLLMNDTETGEYTAYLQGLATALSENNESACKFNYEKLFELETRLKASSASTIQKLISKTKAYKKKKDAKKAKSSVSFIQAETKAEMANKSFDFKTAKTYYDKCIRILKKGIAKAKKEKKKKKRTKSTNDSLYRNTSYDSYTYDYVCNTWFGNSDVRGLSSETRRYYINTLFAAYGYRFNNSTIQSFFDRQAWYTPDYTVAVGDQNTIVSWFSETARHNYNMLRR